MYGHLAVTSGDLEVAGTSEIERDGDLQTDTKLVDIANGSEFRSRIGASEFDTILLPSVSQGTWDYTYDDGYGQFLLMLNE